MPHGPGVCWRAALAQVRGRDGAGRGRGDGDGHCGAVHEGEAQRGIGPSPRRVRHPCRVVRPCLAPSGPATPAPSSTPLPRRKVPFGPVWPHQAPAMLRTRRQRRPRGPGVVRRRDEERGLAGLRGAAGRGAARGCVRVAVGCELRGGLVHLAQSYLNKTHAHVRRHFTRPLGATRAAKSPARVRGHVTPGYLVDWVLGPTWRALWTRPQGMGSLVSLVCWCYCGTRPAARPDARRAPNIRNTRRPTARSRQCLVAYKN